MDVISLVSYLLHFSSCIIPGARCVCASMAWSNGEGLAVCSFRDMTDQLVDMSLAALITVAARLAGMQIMDPDASSA